jgi:hypothetical protein
MNKKKMNQDIIGIIVNYFQRHKVTGKRIINLVNLLKKDFEKANEEKVY